MLLRVMSEGLMATLIQDEDTEFEEAAAPHDQDASLERAITTGWKCYEEGERDVDDLVAAAVEAIVGDVHKLRHVHGPYSDDSRGLRSRGLPVSCCTGESPSR